MSPILVTERAFLNIEHIPNQLAPAKENESLTTTPIEAD